MPLSSRTRTIIHDSALAIPLSLVWMIVSTLTLIFLYRFQQPDELYDVLNDAARMNILLIYIGHIIAFSIVPIIYLSVKRYFDIVAVVAFAFAGAMVVWLQYFFRTFADSIGRLDCANNCVPSVIPEPLGASINAGVLLCLIGVWVVFTGIAVLRYKFPRKTKA